MPNPRNESTSVHAWQRIASNAGWLLFHYGFVMASTGLINIWLANYLGPSNFGTFVFSLSVVMLFSPLVAAGLEPIVIREAIRSPDTRNTIFGSAAAIKLAAACLAYPSCVIAVRIWKPHSPELWTYVAIAGISLLPQAAEIISDWFATDVRSKYSVAAKTIATAISVLVRVILILTHAPLVAFIAIFTFELILQAVTLYLIFRNQGYHITDWKCSLLSMRYMMSQATPILITGMAIMIYMRADVIMLEYYSGAVAVGVYAPALDICNALYVIPVAITASVYPSIVELRRVDHEQYLRRMQQLYDAVTWLAILLAIPLTLLAGQIVSTLYGPQFNETTSVLTYLPWGCIFVFQGVARTKWIIAEELQNYLHWMAIGGVFVSILLNWLLIPLYGPVGAAIATVLTYGTTAVLAPAVFSKTRPLTAQLLLAYAAPVRFLLGTDIYRRNSRL